ncbi:MAG TPA: hypothetical protein VFQ61_20145, partial [Polyangiaceae bacterium]|nr:hypothetical protein [Polyangiaceae bacterium]
MKPVSSRAEGVSVLRSTGACLLLAGLLSGTACQPQAPATTPPSATDANKPPAAAPTALGPASNATIPNVPAQQIAISAAVRAAVDAGDRDAEDRALDSGRHPVEVLSFFGIGPGQRVAELFAGGGYTAELLARVVGAQGRVFAQNSRFILERFAQGPWTERLKKPVMRNVVRVDRELDSPLPPEARDLDAVLFILSYHDSVWMNTDRAAMNRN